MQNSIIIGIDIGSRFTKYAILKNGHIEKLHKIPSIKFYEKINKKQEFDFVHDLYKEKFPETHLFVLTGYGRNTLNMKNRIIIPEIHAHVYGVNHLLSIKNYTLLDIGGQDTKVIKVQNSNISSFLMSDKCASCSGKFLENMANILSIDISYLFQWTDNPVTLNSTCAVFAETEVVGYLSEGIPIKRLCSAINHSIFKKISPLLKQAFSPVIIMTGGVANNSAIQRLIETELEAKVIIPPHPFEIGAIGCAIYGHNKHQPKHAL